MNKVENKQIVYLLLGAAILFGGVGSVLFTVLGGVSSRNDQAAITIDSEPVTKAATPVAYTGTVGVNALEQLRRVAMVATKESQYGAYVDSINGVSGGTDGKYWIFYVDGKQASVGAEAYVSRGGESIEWRFE